MIRLIFIVLSWIWWSKIPPSFHAHIFFHQKLQERVLPWTDTKGNAGTVFNVYLILERHSSLDIDYTNSSFARTVLGSSVKRCVRSQLYRWCRSQRAKEGQNVPRRSWETTVRNGRFRHFQRDMFIAKKQFGERCRTSDTSRHKHETEEGDAMVWDR